LKSLLAAKSGLNSGAPDRATARPVRHRHVPGEIGVWLFIGGDLIVFSVLFTAFMHTRADQLPVFAAGRAQLNQVCGLINTLLMVSSSWCVVRAVNAARRQRRQVAQACLGAALACGVGFWVVKCFEYTEKLAASLTPSTNDFFMTYFIYTGVHLLHVTVGMGVLTGLIFYVRSGEFHAIKLRNIESGASFWHLVDVLWIVLFPLLYLLRTP
jgi:nitric oxide reductase NorE protein